MMHPSVGASDMTSTMGAPTSARLMTTSALLARSDAPDAARSAGSSCIRQMSCDSVSSPTEAAHSHPLRRLTRSHTSASIAGDTIPTFERSPTFERTMTCNDLLRPLCDLEEDDEDLLLYVKVVHILYLVEQVGDEF